MVDRPASSSEILLEEECLAKEIEWLLVKEFPNVCEDLKNIINECIHYIVGKPSNESEDLDEDYKIINFESPGSTVEGYARVEGWNITEAKISVRIPRFNKGQPFQTEISTTPWKLTQLQNAHNYLIRARDVLDAISFQDITLSQASRILSKVANKIKQAQDQLVMVDPSISNFHSQMAFLPKLPNTLNIEFGIVHRSLEINVYHVQELTSLKKTSVNETLLDRDKNTLYEVLEHITVQTPNRRLETIFKFIQTIYDLCSEARERIIALSSMSTSFL